MYVYIYVCTYAHTYSYMHIYHLSVVRKLGQNSHLKFDTENL